MKWSIIFWPKRFFFSLQNQAADLHAYKVEANFYNDAKPDAEPGYLMGLWDYEVVELFLLNSHTEEYLELEFGPHGHFLAWVIV